MLIAGVASILDIIYSKIKLQLLFFGVISCGNGLHWYLAPSCDSVMMRYQFVSVHKYTDVTDAQVQHQKFICFGSAAKDKN